MPILRMKAPAGLHSFSHQGHPAEIVDGVVEIDHRHADDYMQHGFTLVDEPRRAPLAPPREPRPFASSPAVMTLVDKLLGADESTLARLHAVLNEEPDARGAAPLADPAVIHAADPRPAAEPGPIPSEGALTDEQIERMTAAQMKAWLKARDVPMIGVGNDTDVLREKVRAANRG